LGNACQYLLPALVVGHSSFTSGAFFVIRFGQSSTGSVAPPTLHLQVICAILC
jgi:hypothetical protein